MKIFFQSFKSLFHCFKVGDVEFLTIKTDIVSSIYHVVIFCFSLLSSSFIKKIAKCMFVCKSQESFNICYCNKVFTILSDRLFQRYVTRIDKNLNNWNFSISYRRFTILWWHMDWSTLNKSKTALNWQLMQPHYFLWSTYRSARTQPIERWAITFDEINQYVWAYNIRIELRTL
jgi:hypothetical protein